MNVGNVIEKIDSLQKNINLNENHNENVIEKNDNDVKEPIIQDFDKNDIIKIVDELNNSIKILDEKVRFSYHEKTNRVIMKIVDSDTNEVIREIPPKNIIKLLEHIQEYLGLFVDESR